MSKDSERTRYPTLEEIDELPENVQYFIRKLSHNYLYAIRTRAKKVKRIRSLEKKCEDLQSRLEEEKEKD